MAIDNGAETQVVQGLKGRSIYDANFGEIAWKSFVAGLFLGIGRTASSVAIWLIVLVFSVQLLAPVIQPFLLQFQTIINLLQGQQQMQQDFQRNSGNLDQIFQQLNGRGTTSN